MYRLEPQDFVKGRFIGLWSLLAFQAGFINSIGFLACHRFVSHVTGFSSQVGITIGSGNYVLALEMLSAPLAFLLGAWVNGILTIARHSRGLTPRYDLVSIIIPLTITLLMIAGVQGFFGPFGEPLLLFRDFVLLCSLSFVCGLQNACFATLTKGQIRTTHLTGITTDFGTDLSLITNGGSSEERRLARKRNFMRAMTFISFSSGALISALVDARLEYWALLLPAVTSSVVSAIFFSVKYELDIKENSAAANAILLKRIDTL
jgi:uncharacterized membrane protein YoaK (UPF0700 family)